jgi:hypothetical protein
MTSYYEMVQAKNVGTVKTFTLHGASFPALDCVMRHEASLDVILGCAENEP